MWLRKENDMAKLYGRKIKYAYIGQGEDKPIQKCLVLTEDEVEALKTEFARAFRKRMNEKMGKHTHLLGKEYVQRIMREVEKELIGEEDA